VPPELVEQALKAVRGYMKCLKFSFNKGVLYMKSKRYISLIIGILAAFSLSLATCGSTPQADKTSVKSASESIVTQGTQPTPGTPKALVQSVNPYTGSGGKGISLAILTPKATGLTINQGYIPALVQGEFVSNFKGYSTLSVMDRENLDNVYGELSSGYYDDSDEAGLDLGHLPSTDYLMNGSITKTATGYALQMQITKTADKMTAASYSGTCTFTELDNLTGIRRASLDLLQKIGVVLTEQAKTELAGAATTGHVNAQTALAQGITAQQDGTIVEALSYYYQAAAFDSSLLEAASRAGVISAAISSGNIGTDVRNDIQRRKEWLNILEEAENYFKNHQPWEIVYDPTLTQGKIDYSRETVDIFFNVEVRPTDDWKIVQTLIDGLDATGKRDEWDFTWWPLTSRAFADYVPATTTLDRYIDRAGQYAKQTRITFALISEKGTLLVSETSNCLSKATFDVETFNPWDKNVPQKGYRQNDGVGDGFRLIRNDIISTAAGRTTVTFREVNANDITDNMTVKIVSVNGIGAEILAKTGYIKISTGSL
jgi:hypothetical protein